MTPSGPPQTRIVSIATVVAIASLGGCSETEESSPPSDGTTTSTSSASGPFGPACATYASIAATLGCAAAASAEADCLSGLSSMPVDCADEALAWTQCASQYPTDCLCESDDGGLNCEGTYKPDEGSAACLNEYAAFSSCTHAGAGGA